MKVVAGLLLLAVIFGGEIQAASLVTPAGSLNQNLARALDGFRKDNPEKWPDSWWELDGKYVNLERIDDYGGGR